MGRTLRSVKAAWLRVDRAVASTLTAAALVVCILWPGSLPAGEAVPDPSGTGAAGKESSKIEAIAKALEGLSVGTLSYIDYSAGRANNDRAYNRFSITRGYLTVKKQLTPWLGFRITPDVTQETKTKVKLEDGKLVETQDPNSADFKLRLKYLYAELKPPDVGFLTDMKAEVGMGHMPWLDFEEHVNPYRCQGTMFIERAGIFNSADIGVSIMGYLGGQLSKEYQSSVSKYYAGRYGSWHVGVFNGGGYHAQETNGNKIPEVRLSLRPLPDAIPGLQVSYFGIFGQGNTKTGAEYPAFMVNLGMLSYEDSWVTFTGQYAYVKGNQKGTFVDGQGRALRSQGYSLFLDVKAPVLDRKLSLFGRYDHFDPDTKDWITQGDDAYDLAMGGLSFRFFSHCLALLVYEHVFYDANSGGLAAVPAAGKDLADDRRIQAVVQIEF